jgi:hypothetical protein
VDDWIMLFVVVGSLHVLSLGTAIRTARVETNIFLQLTFTGVIVTTNEVANNGSNYLPPGAAELLTPEEVVSAIYGSKMTLILEEFTLATTWLVKACMLLMYSRLT